jgi:Galactose oxidase, central domain
MAVFVVMLVFALGAPEASASATPGWAYGPNMALVSAGGSATVLENGDVLLTTFGGGTLPGDQTELYASGAWSPTGPVADPYIDDTATALADGDALLAGGTDAEGFALAGAQLYDPTTNSWSATTSMSTPREGATATSLPDGDVLVAGGDGASGTALASAEFYDPMTGSWRSAGNMSTARADASSAQLGNGDVLVAGGSNAPSAELYDPSTNSWSPAAPFVDVRGNATLLALQDGDALLIGGNQDEAEIYHWATNTWSDAGSMLDGSGAPHAVELADGRVLTISGPGSDPSAPELYDPTTNRWYWAGADPIPAYDPALFSLPNGDVMAAGGTIFAAGGGEGSASLDSTEVYTPGPTPTLSNIGVESVSQTTAAVSGSYDTSTARVQDCEVLYGTSINYGHTAACAQPGTTSSGSGEIAATIDGLEPDTSYHYQVLLSDGAVITTSTDQSFTTPPEPPASTTRTCVVPRLKKLHPAAAIRALQRAGCSRGKLKRTRALKSRLRRDPRTSQIVIAQSEAARRTIAASSPVNLTLGIAPSTRPTRR